MIDYFKSHPIWSKVIVALLVIFFTWFFTGVFDLVNWSSIFHWIKCQLGVYDAMRCSS